MNPHIQSGRILSMPRIMRLDSAAGVRDVPCQTATARVGQWFGRARPCRAGPAPNPALTFIDRAWAGPAPNPSLLSTGPGPARPPSLHFYRQGLGRSGPAPKPSLLSTGPGPARPPNPSLLSTGPRPARPSTHHFYWPDPSLLLASPLPSSGHPLVARSWPSWAIPANRSVVYG